ncbi:MAG: D-cysteine desulfhydrase family protein [Clostridia bacterium]|nr:D-cysteine desulfhydrase family protein [Clostridia bacterium]
MLGYEKVSFLGSATPLEYLPSISKELGLEFYIKRDDLTGLGVGGNKLRKLEYLLHEAQQQGATTLLTMGGAQTNHGRLTAAVAAKFGMKCVIVCLDEYPGEVSANILLDRLMGAEVVLKKNDGRPADVQYAETVAAVRARYEEAGEKVYEIPIGGSNVTGMLGYYECAVEITRQAEAMGIGDATLISTVGSFGTYMGLFCGLKNENSPLRLKGIAISPFDEAKKQRLLAYYQEAKEKLGLSYEAKAEDFEIETEYTRGAYNNESAEVREAIYLMARKEAIILDPCYTGKAFAGILEMVESGKLEKGSKVIFLHTGGLPGIYTKHHRLAFERELIDGVTILP